MPSLDGVDGIFEGSRTAYAAPPMLSGARQPQCQPQTLLRISIELARQCNLECTYCYTSFVRKTKTWGLALGDAQLVVDQAVDLGAEKIVIVGGGEPFLVEWMRPTHRRNLVEYIAKKGARIDIFTNGTLLSRRIVEWLHDLPVSVIGKLNSLDARTQDFLVGIRGAAERIYRGIDLLLSAGFARAAEPRLALETVICRQNYDALPALWRWMRCRNIIPYVEIITVQGRARENRELLLFPDAEAPRKYKELFEELLRIDREEFGYDWVPHPPHVARRCDLYHTNCYINCHGGVQPCAGVEVECGHLRVGEHAADGKLLADILSSAKFKRYRRVEEYIGEPCRSCKLLSECYGCRGNCWNTTGSEFAGDHTCWRGQPVGSGVSESL